MPPEPTTIGGRPAKGLPPTSAPGAARPKRPRWKRAVDWLSVGLLTVTLLLLAVAFYGSVNNRWYQVVAVQGQSMEPTIDQGDLILFTRPENPEAGDIGVFQVDGKIVTHRIVEIGSDGSFVTRGDANPTIDDWSGAQVQLVGIYRAKIPLLGHLWG